MKINKKVVSVLLILIMVANMLMISVNKVYAETDKSYATEEEYNEAMSEIINTYGSDILAKSPYEFSAREVMALYTYNSVHAAQGKSYYAKYSVDVQGKNYIPLDQYEENGTKFPNSVFQDNALNAIDTSNIQGALCIDFLVANGSATKESWYSETRRSRMYNSAVLSVLNRLEDAADDELENIIVHLKVMVPEINKEVEVDIGEHVEQISDETWSEIQSIKDWYENRNGKISGAWKFDLTVITKNGEKFSLAMGNDDNFYMLRRLVTQLTYKSYGKDNAEISGAMSGNTYVIENALNTESKENSYVIATIQSKTNEGICAVNDVKLTAENTKSNPNSQGWYYPDTSDMRVVAKVYNCKDYTANKVEENVKLTGVLQGVDYQDVSIKWEVSNSEFKTELDYESKEPGKKQGDTYYPQYTVDEDSNAKKDLDVTATITSKTSEDIVKVTIGDITDELTDANISKETATKLGWFYPDKDDKKKIAKVYEFDTYDNTVANGKVKETVKVTGSKGGEDTQIPSIEWTFRRIDKSQKENSDGSTTVVITYNLPVDEKSIPDGWKPIYDEDGKTIHKITKTIPKGEKYEKDVTVSQNGNPDKKVTTPVKVDAKADNLGPQAGAFSVMFIILISCGIVLAVAKYRKIRK